MAMLTRRTKPIIVFSMVCLLLVPWVSGCSNNHADQAVGSAAWKREYRGCLTEAGYPTYTRDRLVMMPMASCSGILTWISEEHWTCM